MKKIASFIVVFLGCLSFLNAESRVAKLKQTVSVELPFIDGWCSKEKAMSFIDLVLQEKKRSGLKSELLAGRLFIRLPLLFNF